MPTDSLNLAKSPERLEICKSSLKLLYYSAWALFAGGLLVAALDDALFKGGFSSPIGWLLLPLTFAGTLLFGSPVVQLLLTRNPVVILHPENLELRYSGDIIPYEQITQITSARTLVAAGVTISVSPEVHIKFRYLPFRMRLPGWRKIKIFSMFKMDTVEFQKELLKRVTKTSDPYLPKLVLAGMPLWQRSESPKQS